MGLFKTADIFHHLRPHHTLLSGCTCGLTMWRERKRESEGGREGRGKEREREDEEEERRGKEGSGGLCMFSTEELDRV
jgi:hypothetical protein